MKYPLLLATILLLTSCSIREKGINKFSDPVLLAISDLQDRRATDSLALYLQHKNPSYRKEAALACASVQDTTLAPLLRDVLLNDEVAEVRALAGLALGQTFCQASEKALQQSVAQEKDSLVLREVLEALGRTLSKENVSTLTDYQSSSSLASEGRARGLYRLALRGIKEEVVVSAAYENLSSSYTKSRLAAAQFFARTSLTDFTDRNKLLQFAASDPDVFVRMAATQGLRNVKTEDARLLLQKNARDKDERVRISAVRALRVFPYAAVAHSLFDALSDSSLQVRVAAAEAMINFAPKEAAQQLAQAADIATDWRVQSTLYGIVAVLDPKPSTFQTIQKKYSDATNTYYKSALLTVLGGSAQNYNFIGKELINSNDPVILSSAALSLASCNSASDFSDSKRPDFLQWYRLAIEKGDAAVTGIIAQVLGDSTKKYKSLIKDVSFLREARKKLSLPKDNESIQPLETTLAYLEGRKAEEVKNDFNHPIDWSFVKTISEKQQAIIKTTKGDIVITLFVNEAPGSVANFVMLARQNYFNGKFFHRVVPNFVIQAGCNRGDGYGSEDYSIRSEFTSRRYTEGSIGMASAGKDTEGTQWFITHSPTPHLDGRYTIFAEVVNGMDVVNAVGVGDQILDVQIK